MTSTGANKGKNSGSKKKNDIDNIENEDIEVAAKKQANNSGKNEAKNDDSKKAKASSDESAIADELNNELAQERDKYLRLAAEYKNFRDRSSKEREMIYSDARTDTIAKLLPVYDNLERALKMECADEAFYKGVEMTMTQLLEIFENMDVKPISAVGEPFDPNRHNAVMTVENPELGSKIVADELQKGFMLGEKVIRFSTVVVAN